MEEQLRLLQEQFDEGYISEAVYNQRKQALMNQQGITPTGDSESQFLANQNSDASMDFAMRNMGGQPDMDYSAFEQPQGFTFNQPQQYGITSDFDLAGNTGLTGSDMYSFPSQNGMPTYNQPSGQENGSSNTTVSRTPYEFKTREDYVNYRNENGYDKTTAGEDWDAYNQALDGDKSNPQNQGGNNLFEQFMPFFNPYGSNVQTDLYQLGSALGMPKGAQGKGLGVASSAAALGLGAGRTLMSGFANSRQTARAQEDTRNQMMQRNYRPQMQYGNTNYRGGTV